MKTPLLRIPAISFLVAMAGLSQAEAANSTLTSPDGKWTLSSDEFGAYGESSGPFTQRDFGDGAGLTRYSWAASMLVTEGTNKQWLTGTDLGLKGQVLLGAGNLISDATVSGVRTSAFSVTGVSGLRVDLVQRATNLGIFQQYTFTNSRATSMSLGLTSFHDVDLDNVTSGEDSVALVNGTLNTLRISQNTRNIFFAVSSGGYVGFLAGFVPAGGVTGNLDAVAFDNSGIPLAARNGFWDVSAGAVGASVDANNDKIGDIAADVGYLFQNNLVIPAGGSMSFAVGTQSIPEPSSALLALLGAGLLLRRRRG